MKLIEYRKIAKQVEADLRVALAKHGLNLKPFGARIDERLGIITMKLECSDENHKAADGTATTPERELFKQYAGIYGMEPDWLDRKFSMGGSNYTIDGLKQRGTKNVLIKRVGDGKVFVSTPESVVAFVKLTETRRAS